MSKKKNLFYSYILSRANLALKKELRENNIEIDQVHFRNDKYSIFKKLAKNIKFPNMDFLENKYLVLPVQAKMNFLDAEHIADQINKYIK